MKGSISERELEIIGACMPDAARANAKRANGGLRAAATGEGDHRRSTAAPSSPPGDAYRSLPWRKYADEETITTPNFLSRFGIPSCQEMHRRLSRQ